MRLQEHDRLPDAIDLVRKSAVITPFKTDMDYPGHLVAWATSYLLVRYRSGMRCAYPIMSNILLPVGMAGGGTRLDAVWLQQELRRLGNAMVMDLACLGITGGVKLKCKPRGKGNKGESSCAVGGHGAACRCHEGMPVTVYGPRNWRWRAAEELTFVSPARVRPVEEAFRPVGAKVEIGMLVKVDLGRGERVDALVPKSTGRA